MTLATTEHDDEGILTMTLNAPDTPDAISGPPMAEAILGALIRAQAEPVSAITRQNFRVRREALTS